MAGEAGEESVFWGGEEGEEEEAAEEDEECIHGGS
jgi:hypothetical protein